MNPTETPHEGECLDLAQEVSGLALDLINMESVSGNEHAIAGAIERALRRLGHLEVVRDGDAVMARTNLHRTERVILAGHLDTVPLPTVAGSKGTVPAARDGEVIYGRGATDMKGGVAVQLGLAASLTEPMRDVTYVFYDNEEVESARNGLGRLVSNYPDWFKADFAVILEPSNSVVEGGCNGFLQAVATTHGVSAHSARSWMGTNAIHGLADILVRLRDHVPAEVEVDGLVYKESLSAVGISGGIAGNVIPDKGEVEINYRFAPDRSTEQAAEYVRTVLAGFDVHITDGMSGARPGLNHPVAKDFIAAVGGSANPKYGWTDVARLSELGIPAVNYGPGNAMLAHTDNEHVRTEDVQTCLNALAAWLS
ncbi:succinyl-diaminopimelate desuccinylase [Pseudarthrobacter sp. S9]|uniref:succinyl-diaminopimelate desuccinylase n=1 Tax=Pseudarthrobacter sp. S9 TaxID=3418421 RepID=UPI003CFC8938